MKTKRSVFLSLILSAALVQGTAIINFTADEGFLEGSLDGQQGWSVNNFPDRANVFAGGLSYSNGAVVHNGGSQSMQIISGNRVDLNDDTSEQIGEARAFIGIPTIAAGETFYFSFLHNHNAAERNFFYFAFSNGADNDNSSISAVGQNANIDGSQQPRLRSRVRTSEGAQSQVNGTAGIHDMGNFTTNLVVGEAFFGGDSANSTIRLWMNPTSLNKDDNPNSFVNAGLNIGINEINTLWIRGDGGAGGNFLIDHIMIGDSWEAVVIPEPSTYAALFGLLALGFLAWRRRR